MKDLNEKTQFAVYGLERNPELMPHIYQQFQELTPFMLPDTQAGLIVKKVGEKKGAQNSHGGNPLAGGFQVTLFLMTGEVRIEATASEKDLYSATTAAKNQLLENLGRYQDEMMSSRERDLEVEMALKSPYIH